MRQRNAPTVTTTAEVADMEGTQKTYTITTDNDAALKRAVMADSTATVLCVLDEWLRQKEKHGTAAESEYAEYWRDLLRGLLNENGVTLDDLYE